MKLPPRFAAVAFTAVVSAFAFLASCGIAGAQPVFQTVHSFKRSTEGGMPKGMLIQASDGNFYGTTTIGGGASNSGTIFRMTSAGTVTVLHIFTGGSDGGAPYAGLIQASDGNLYGTTSRGGISTSDVPAGNGTVFQMTLAGAFTVVHAFSGDATDGSQPLAGLLEGSDGNFYGTTSRGGTFDVGTVFTMTPAGTVTVLHSFAGAPSEGSTPGGALIQSSSGDFLGTTTAGGASNFGTIFRMDIGGVVTVLHAFDGATDGAGPGAALVEASDGNFYGTTPVGGGGNPTAGAGVAFRMNAAGDVIVLHHFLPIPPDGTPNGPLIQAADGNFYGTTINGGSANQGAVFRMTTDGVVSIAHSFLFTVDIGAGATPYGGVVEASDGNLYGTTTSSLPPTLAGAAVRLVTSKASMTSPAAGSALGGANATFTWLPGFGATSYWLEVGTTSGGHEIFGQSAGAATTQDVSGLPVLGSTIYVRLWTLRNGSWLFTDYTYTAANGKAVMTSPSPGVTLGAGSVTFNWSAGISASSYWLEVGTAAGQGNLFEQGVGLSTSQAVNGLPILGGAVYVRLWTQLNGSWLYNDYTYNAANAKAAMASPTQGSVLSGPSVTFNWAAAAGAAQYWLEVGTGAGQGNIFEQGVGLAMSQTVSGLPVLGNPVYVRLWTQLNGSWLYNDYSYTATNAKAVMTSPAPGSVVGGTSIAFSWSAGTGASSYWLEVGTGVGQSNLYGQSVGLAMSQTVSGLPIMAGTLYVRLWSQLNGAWLYNDYTYTATSAKAAMVAPHPGSSFGGVNVAFTWSTVAGATLYWLDIGTAPGQSDLFSESAGLSPSKPVTGLPFNGRPIYVRLWTQFGSAWVFNDYTYTSFNARASMTSPVQGSELAGSTVTFTWTSLAAAAEYWLEVGTAVGAGNIFDQSVGLSTSWDVSGIPTDANPVYARLWTRYGSLWQYNDYSYVAHLP